MKKFIFNIAVIFLILLFSGMNTSISATSNSPKKQVSYRSDCIVAQATMDLEISKVRANLSIGRYFGRVSMIGPKYQLGIFPYEFNPFFNTSYWLGGYDAFNNLKVAASTFRSMTSNDFWAGPINPETNGTNMAACNEWDKFFTISGQNVEIHKSGFLQAQSSGVEYKVEDIPAEVLGWPGIGNPYFESVHGFAIPSYVSHLAPFFDLNEDGIYDPKHGDYPYNYSRTYTIKGDLEAKQHMAFSISNDIGNIHTSSRGFPIGAEIRTLAFGFDTDEKLGEMLFFNTKIHNHGPGQINQFYAGIWSDTNGYCSWANNYLGFDSTRNMAYLYEIIEEGQCECTIVGSNCSLVPVSGMRMYHGFRKDQDTASLQVSSFIYYNNGGIGGALPAMIDPSQAIEFYRYLSGVWRDGTPLTYGGNGYNTGSTAITKYAYPSNPSSADPNNWSMCNTAPSLADRMMLMSTGPITLAPGGINDFTFGTMAALVPHSGCPDITILQENSDVAADLFDPTMVSTDLFSGLENNTTKLFPNPYFLGKQGHNICLQFKDLPSTCELSLIDMQGRTLAYSNIKNIAPDQFNWEPGAANLAQGLYFIRVAQKNGTQQILKFLIME
ncbi:MAG: T9SS type A sorting domain-containing protein [Saprospiraceae bacterium]|nr:T9SS type A sorting domain-containing protein [Saprospiraceae bacterium]